ncbi:MAG: hypothetical protein BEN19_06430 [Epulopiscium sp. Nuni2H_MBin003]|nr:MAG: hypothetical protein BEN19_06430 [Epulopiscium sp. Nuni2H_MBin003]
MNRNILKVIIPIILILLLSIKALNIGSIELSFTEMIEMLRGIDDKQYAIVRITRVPAIFVGIICGAMFAMSGVLLQAVMKNPLADPSIIGISGGASFGALLAVSLFPDLLIMKPIFALIFGVLACSIVYSLAWKGALNPVRVILVGIAINTLFNGLEDFVSYFLSAGFVMPVSTVSTGGHTSQSVNYLIIYFVLALILGFCMYKKCNVLGLGDHNAHSLGINVDQTRLIISVVAVFLAIIPTMYIGPISFVGLIVPHIGRKLVGNNHKYLILYSGLLGGFLLLFADVISRSIIYPIEIPLDIIMALIGAPFFLYMIRKGNQYVK